MTSPPSKMVAGGKQCATGSTITPSKTCSANIYRCIKRRVGRSLRRAHCKGNLVPSRKQVPHKPPRAESSISSSKRVSNPLLQQDSTDSYRKHNSGSLYQQRGGMKSGSLCALLWRILSWCTRQQVTLRARHIPGRVNVIADKLSRLGQTIQTEWSLHSEVFQAICSRWHQPQVDLFATRFNNKLPQFVSPVQDPQAWAVDALSLSWEGLDPYAFPPAAILGKVVEKLQDYPCNWLILIAPGGAQHTLVLESGDNVQSDSTVSAQHSPLGVSAIQPGPSQEPGKSEPTCLAPRASAIKEQWFSEAVAARIEAPQRGSTRSVYEAKWAIFTQWCLSNQVDFRAPPLKVIADFLLHLFQDKKLQLGTIDGYRSAIADKLGNSTINVSKDENLTRLLDSFHRDRPKGRRFSCWLWVLVSTGVGSMLGYIGTSDTSQTGLRSPCTLHPAFCPRISWRRRDQIVWPQWPYQLWPLLWISHSRMTGHYVQLEPCATTWTGPQILGRIRSWSLSPSRKGLIKTSLLPLSPHGSNRL